MPVGASPYLPDLGYEGQVSDTSNDTVLRGTFTELTTQCSFQDFIPYGRVVAEPRSGDLTQINLPGSFLQLPVGISVWTNRHEALNNGPETEDKVTGYRNTYPITILSRGVIFVRIQSGIAKTGQLYYKVSTDPDSGTLWDNDLGGDALLLDPNQYRIIQAGIAGEVIPIYFDFLVTQ